MTIPFSGARAMARTPLLAAFLMAVLAASVAAAPPDEPKMLGRIIRLIVVRTETGEPLPGDLELVVLGRMETKVGQRIVLSRVNKDLHNLYKLLHNGERQFDRIEISYRTVGLDGVRLFVLVERRKQIKGIIFQGRKEIAEATLLAAISQKPPRRLSLPAIKKDIETIKDTYKKEGYQFIQVRHRKGMGQVIFYDIEEGPQVKVEAIRFSGNHGFTAGKLRDQMVNTKESNLLRKGRYTKEGFEDDLRSLGRFYRSQGHLEAVAEAESLEYSPDKSSMIITIHIREGRRFKVGLITYEGNEYFTNAELASRMKQKEGTYFDGNLFHADQKAIRDLYGDDAFIDVKMGERNSGPSLVYRLEEPVVDIEYRIVEGRQVYVGRITIVGNKYTKESVIRRALSLVPGGKYSLTDRDKSRERLVRTRFFDDVKIEIKRRVEKTRVIHDVKIKVIESDAVVTVKEKEHYGQFQFGGALSSDLGVLGFLSFTRENFDATYWPKSWRDFIDGKAFLGAGQRLAVRLAPGLGSVSTYSIDFRDPQFRGSNYAFGTNLSIFERDRDEYTEGRGGIDLSLRKRLGNDKSLGFGFRLVNVDISSVEPGAPPDVVSEKGSNIIGAARASLSKDTRRYRNSLLPYEGTSASVEAELASVVFGSSFNFLKVSQGVTHYTTLRIDRYGYPHILKSSISLSMAQDIGDDVPFFERFYAGGSSFRGFEFRGVGPHQMGEPVGAQSSLLGTFEYNFPILGDMLRGVTFVDYGVLDKDAFAIGTPRASFGFGVRFFARQLPIPIAVDIGIPLLTDSDDDTEFLTFSLGGRIY